MGTDSPQGSQVTGETIIRPKHHILVRWGHWCCVPLLLGLILSGVSIYWSSPIYQHAADATTGSFDVAADFGIWICAHVPGQQSYSSPPDWLYNHLSLGPGMLGAALRLHWFCAYLFMLNGFLYLIGLVLGGGWRALILKRHDLKSAIQVARYYSGLPFAFIFRQSRLKPAQAEKYNSLQKASYVAVALAAILVVASGWAIHKPAQLHWLAAALGGYDAARVWHFWLMWFFVLFVGPHVVLVLADGWDTLRSMIVGWSEETKIAGANDEAI